MRIKVRSLSAQRRRLCRGPRFALLFGQQSKWDSDWEGSDHLSPDENRLFHLINTGDFV